MSKTNYLEDNLINHVLRQVPYAGPPSIWLALFTTAPTESGGGVEVSGGSYARQQVTFAVPSNGASSNDAVVLFPVASANWGVVTSFALMDASVGGNVLYYANLNAPWNIQTNAQPTFPIGQLAITED